MKHFIAGMFDYWKFLFTGKMDPYHAEEKDFKIFILGGRAGAILLTLLVIAPVIALLLCWGA